MKKYLLSLLVAALLVPSVAFSAPVSWDFTSSVLQPLQSAWSSLVRVNNIVATSTTATSTFPNLSATSTRIAGSLYDGSNSRGTNGMVLQSSGSGISWVATSTLGITGHDPVTLSGVRDYITLVGQDIVRGVIDISDDTNLAGDSEVVLTGDALSLASGVTRDSEISTESALETFLTDVTNVFTNNDGALADDNLGNNSIEDLNDVAAMTEATGDFLTWSGATWTNSATSSIGYLMSMNGLTAPFQRLATTSAVGGFGFSSSGSTHTLNIPTAGATTALGLLSAADWSTFNSKLSSAITSLGGQTGATQTFASSSAVGGFGIISSGDTHTLRIPTAGATTVLGLLSDADWSTFNAKQAAITDGDALTFSGATLNFDGGNAPGGELGGTWASPTIDDSLAVTNWNLTTPTLTSFFGTPCTGNQFLQDIADTGAFTCADASGGGGGSLSTSTDNNAEVGETISYITTDFYVGGSASNTAEFNFDKNYPRFTMSSTTSSGGYIGVATTANSFPLVGNGIAVQGNGFFAGNATATNITATGTLKIGALADSASSLGSNGMVLQTNGSVATWVATSTLGFTGSGGISSLGGQTGATQTFASSTPASGGWGFSSAANIHTLTIPGAGAATPYGLLSSTDWNTFNNKQATLSAGYQIGISGTSISSTALGTTSIDTVAKIEAIAGAVNILTETEIDASAELLALMDDETGSGALVFGTSPTFTTNATFFGDLISDFTGFGLSLATGALGIDTTGAANGECLKYNSTGPAINWDACGAGGGTPSGSDTQVQFNDGGAFGGAVGFVWNKTRSLLGIGSTTPYATVAIQSSTTTIPVFAIATTTGSGSELFSVFASSTILSNIYSLFGHNGVGVNVGRPPVQYQNTGIRDALYVNGTINSSMRKVSCDSGQIQVAVSADANAACGDFAFQVDAGSTLTFGVGGASSSGATLGTLTFPAATANAGGGIFHGYLSGSSGAFGLASSTPVFEILLYPQQIAGAVGSTTVYIGFSNLNITGTTFETEPTAGCYLTASTTRANFHAICRTSVSAYTMVDTGVASATPTAAGVLLRGEADNLGFRVYAATSTKSFTQVANITTNIPTVGVNFGFWVGKATGGNSSYWFYSYIDLWFRPMWQRFIQ
jgi:hypothetical protein